MRMVFTLVRRFFIILIRILRDHSAVLHSFEDRPVASDDFKW